MTLPTVSWDETTPAGTEALSLGDNRIREMKVQLRELIGYDHEFESGNNANFGYHNKVTLYTGATPSTATDCAILYAKDVGGKAELHLLSTAGADIQLTSGGQFIGGFTNEIRIHKGTLASIPTGWALCDGDGGRPDLANYFVRGVATSDTAPGTAVAGGTVTLTEANLPAHTHTATLASSGAHTHTYSVRPQQAETLSGGIHWKYTFTTGVNATTAENSSHTHTVTDGSTFAATAKTFNPPYYEVAFIIKT